MADVSVLVADDESMLRKFMATVITCENLPVSELFQAPNGLEALRLAREHAPDIAFLDIRMPGMDGLEVAEQLVSEGFGGKIFIISAHNEFAYFRKALRAGVSDYLLKPVKPEDVSEAVLGVARAKDEAGKAAERATEATPAPALVRAVLAHIAANLGAELRLESIAKAVHMSPCHLSRTFKRQSGKNVADAIREARVERAKELLVGTELSITEIGYMLGFHNSPYFATSFKRLCGATPSEFRRAGQNAETARTRYNIPGATE